MDTPPEGSCRHVQSSTTRHRSGSRLQVRELGVGHESQQNDLSRSARACKARSAREKDEQLIRHYPVPSRIVADALIHSLAGNIIRSCPSGARNAERSSEVAVCIVRRAGAELGLKPKPAASGSSVSWWRWPSWPCWFGFTGEAFLDRPDPDGFACCRRRLTVTTYFPDFVWH